MQLDAPADGLQKEHIHHIRITLFAKRHLYLRPAPGLLWVWPSPVDLNALADGPRDEDIPILPEVEIGSGWDPDVTTNTFRDFPYDYATLSELCL